MKRFITILLAAALIAALGVPALADGAAETVVTIYTTNDIHGTVSAGEDEGSETIIYYDYAEPRISETGSGTVTVEPGYYSLTFVVDEAA